MSVVPGRRVIRAVARLVPSHRREAWRQEWEAEAVFAWRRLEREGRAGPAAAFRLRMRVLTCTFDALWERKETMTMTGWLDDLRVAARSLARAPGFTAVAVLTLALGIGADTAVFTLVDGVLLKPLPFPEPDRLVAVTHQGRGGEDQLAMSQGLWVLYREQASSLEDIALHRAAAVNLVAEGEPERVTGRRVTPGFFEILRVPPLVGRAFLDEDGLPGAEPVVLLGEGLWRERFGADPGVVDRTVDIDGDARRVVGVVPGLAWPDPDARLWLPMTVDPANAPIAAFGARGVARLAPGATPASAHAQLEGLVSRLPELYPGDGAVAFLGTVGLESGIEPLKDAVVGDLDRTLWILLGTVGFVLLIACANVANLFLVRAEGRQRELALRAAVGAGRFDLLRPMLAESLVLAAAGGVLGVAMAAVAVSLAESLAPATLPRMTEVGIDGRVLAFTAGTALVSAALFGLLPALRQRMDRLAEELKEGAGRGGTDGRGRHRLRSGLIVVQVALALVLLVGSALMFRTFLALRGVEPGFDPENVLAVRLSVPPGEVPDDRAAADFFRGLRERVAVQPGVEAVGTVAAVPLSGILSFGGLEIEDHPTHPGEIPPMVSFQEAGPGYFETLDIPLLEGRLLLDDDLEAGTGLVVVSESFARRWWPDESALGRRVGGDGEWFEIVGVVGDARYAGLQEPAEEMVYFPPSSRTLDLVVRVAGDPAVFLPVVRAQAAALNPRIPLSSPRSLDDVVRRSMSRTSFTVVMLGAASGVALLLGLVGIYGVIAYVVSQRTREIGVRMALGASAAAVQGMVVRQGLALAGLGVTLGLVAARGLSSVMASLLYGVSATDPWTYAGVAAALALMALMASLIPARRASRVHPAEALRSE